MTTKKDPFADYKTADLLELLLESREVLEREATAYKEAIRLTTATTTKLEGELLRRLSEEGASTQKFGCGSITRVMLTKYAISDAARFEEFVLEQRDSSYYTKAVAKTAVEAYRQEHGDIPPGIIATQNYTLRVNKA